MPILNISDTTTKNENQEDKDIEKNIGPIEEMYEAGIHFGYSRSSRHPSMEKYLFGLRNNIEIFDLEIVLDYLNKASDFLKDLGRERKRFLIVSTKPEIKDFIESIGKDLDMPYVSERWLGGTLTNFDILKKNIKKLEELSKRKQSGEFEKHSKKEKAGFERELSRMEKRFGGLRAFAELPSAVLVVDSKEEKLAVKEAKMKNISIVAILNSDCDSKLIDYPVPGNDSAVTSVEYLLGKLVDAYKEGLKEKPKVEEKKSEKKEKKAFL